MPPQKSYSEQRSRPWQSNRQQQWQRNRSYSYVPPPQYPRPPPPPPPPPIEISAHTKSKLKKFQFQQSSPRLDGAGRGTSRLVPSPKPAAADSGWNMVDAADIITMLGRSAASAKATFASDETVVNTTGHDQMHRKNDQGQTAPAAEPAVIKVADEEAKEEADKENSLPSTQPNKMTPPEAATPEFLSIHVATPRARFAWQELAGTPDTPKVREALGISPNVQLSWGTEGTQMQPFGVAKQSKKRTRGSSPPSSPSLKSRKVADNIQKFKDALKTALANPAPTIRKRLSRHRTAVDRSPATAAPTDAEPHAPPHNGPSPRTALTLRRTMSCGDPQPKRRKLDPYSDADNTPISVGQSHNGSASHAPDKTANQLKDATAKDPSQHSHPGACDEREQKNCPSIRSVSLKARDRPADPTTGIQIPKVEEATDSRTHLDSTDQVASQEVDMLSDFGEDFFDDDLLADIDAKLAPKQEPQNVHSMLDDLPLANASVEISGNAENHRVAKEEFDEFDDLFTASDDLMAELDAEKPGATSAAANIVVNAGDEVGVAEDVFDDDFGVDFDFDEVEKAATQAAAQHISPPLAALPNSTQKGRAIQRYLVTNVIPSSYTDSQQRVFPEKILVVQGERSSSSHAVHLRGDWIETPANAKAFVHIIGRFDSLGVCIVDNDSNMVILHPDQLVSSTVVADSFSCTRRAVLQDRVKATSDPSPALVYGTLLHEIFQDALMANQWSHAYLSKIVDKVIVKHLEDLYTIQVDTTAAREHLLSKTGELQAWADLFVTERPKENAYVQARNGEKVKMCVSKLLDVEEHVWSPMYGLKGNIDATVQVTMQSSKESRTLTVPFELKTGRNANSSHQAQTVLYTLLLSDRYDLEVVYGVLYYLENSQMMRIPSIRHELRQMIMQRNELACHIRERSVQLPPMKRSPNACGRCYAQMSCFIYHKLADNGDGDTSGMGDKFDEVVKHLTPKYKEFFLKWEDLLTKEEKESQKHRRELWTMLSSERQKLGRCFGDVVILEGSAHEEKNSPKINRFHYTFVKETAASGFSFLDSQLAVGEPIVISDEQGHFALALGYVTSVRRQKIDVAVDRRLHNARVRQPGFDKETNQVFAGIMEASSDRARAMTKTAKPEDAQKQTVVRYRLDKDEFSNGMAIVRNNLIQIMARSQLGSDKARNLLIDLVPPRFKAVSTQYVLDDVDSLNIDQMRAIEKVMSAQDYALVLGMPGTGKTTTIAHIIRALVRQGKSVLLTSYMHTAVDNILLKLKTSKIQVLRLGPPAKVLAEVRDFAILAGEPQPSFEAIRHAWHDSPVVATTCLGISHPIFNERTFDYCIVDEASQITLPICLGPIRMASTFVLVGDHNQLPPLVQNEDARVGGLDMSLFKLLSDTHPTAVVNLEHQYRMCEDIMTLSNELVYNGRLKCGTEALRYRSLDVPNWDRLRQHHHDASSVARLTPRSFCGGTNCWLRDLLRPETRMAFVNTDAIEGSREEVKGSRFVNPCEAQIVAQIVESLMTVGVPAEEIGVMTPYRSQLALLNHQLRRALGHGRGGKESAVEMHTADKFQGRDKEVVVFSLVRSNEAASIGDLLKDWRRINVAFTRAKAKLLVVGSYTTAKGNGKDDDGTHKTGNGHAGFGNSNNDDNNKGDSNSNASLGEDMLARAVGLMEERGWIYDMPSDALGSHLFEEYPSTQAAASLGKAEPHSPCKPSVKTEPAWPAKSPAKPSSQKMRTTLAGKENRQPLKRATIGEGTLLKGKPVLQGILNDLKTGNHV